MRIVNIQTFVSNFSLLVKTVQKNLHAQIGSFESIIYTKTKIISVLHFENTIEFLSLPTLRFIISFLIFENGGENEIFSKTW